MKKYIGFIYLTLLLFMPNLASGWIPCEYVITEADITSYANAIGQSMSASSLPTHASRHNWQGSDPIDRGTENLTVVTLPTTSTPDVLNDGTDGVVRYLKTNNSSISAGSFVTGETYIITLVGTTDFTAIGAASNAVDVIFTATGAGSGTGTADIVITDLDDGTGSGSGDATANHSAIGSGKWTVIQCQDSHTNFKFDSNSKFYREGPDLNFSCLSTNPFDLYFRFDLANDRWICDDLPAGLINPTTMAVGKIQTNYDISAPKSKTYTNDDEDQTPGVDILGSVVRVTGNNNSDPSSIDLQDAGSGYDGLKLSFETYSLVDIDDPFSVDVETDSTCVNCPFSGIFTFYATGGSVDLNYEDGVGYHFKDYYHPVFDWATSTSISYGRIDDGAGGDPTANMWCQIVKRRCFCDFYIDGNIDNVGGTNYFTISVPFTSSNNSNLFAQGTVLWEEGSYDGNTGDVSINNNSTTAYIYRLGDWDDVTQKWTDGIAVKGWGSFQYPVK